jgi:hypothetical protein
MRAHELFGRGPMIRVGVFRDLQRIHVHPNPDCRSFAARQLRDEPGSLANLLQIRLGSALLASTLTSVAELISVWNPQSTRDVDCVCSKMDIVAKTVEFLGDECRRPILGPPGFGVLV